MLYGTGRLAAPRSPTVRPAAFAAPPLTCLLLLLPVRVRQGLPGVLRHVARPVVPLLNPEPGGESVLSATAANAAAAKPSTTQPAAQPEATQAAAIPSREASSPSGSPLPPARASAPEPIAAQPSAA